MEDAPSSIPQHRRNPADSSVIIEKAIAKSLQAEALYSLSTDRGGHIIIF